MAWNPSKTVLDSLTWNFKKGEVTDSLTKQIENKNNIKKIRGVERGRSDPPSIFRVANDAAKFSVNGKFSDSESRSDEWLKI